MVCAAGPGDISVLGNVFQGGSAGNYLNRVTFVVVGNHKFVRFIIFVVELGW